MSRALTLTSSVQAGAVQVAIHDTGAGVSDADVQRVFEPFYTTKPDGMGMGLSISRTIVEAHGGRLWVQNGSPGAVFCFSLPVMPADEIDIEAAMNVPHRAGSEPRADRSAGV
jgi:signal transduction histidine kinase